MNTNREISSFNADELSALEVLLRCRIESCEDAAVRYKTDEYTGELEMLKSLHVRIEAAEPFTEPADTYTEEGGFRYPTGMTAEIVIGLICNLWDSNYMSYWGIRGDVTRPEGYDQKEAPGDGGWTDGYCAKYTVPLMGGSVALFDSETVDFDDADQKPDWHLDGEAIQRGLDCFPRYAKGRHYADAISQNDDATTADVFVQCCIFGGVPYG
jgi:hypothetical protein